MTNRDVLRIAMEQSAADLCANAEDFTRDENVIVFSAVSDRARRYLKLPFSCQLVSYGSNVVASVSPECEHVVRAYLDQYDAVHLFETPNLHTNQRPIAPWQFSVRPDSSFHSLPIL